MSPPAVSLFAPQLRTFSLNLLRGDTVRVNHLPSARQLLLQRRDVHGQDQRLQLQLPRRLHRLPLPVRGQRVRLAALPQRRRVPGRPGVLPLLLPQRLHWEPLPGVNHDRDTLISPAAAPISRHGWMFYFMILSNQIPVNWCRSSPCQNGGRCRPKDASFVCECSSGWSGRLCDVRQVSCETAAQKRGILTRLWTAVNRALARLHSVKGDLD